MKKILIRSIVCIALLSSCAFKKSNEESSSNDALKGHGGIQIDPSEIDNDGDMLSLKDEVSLGASDNIVTLPKIIPVSVSSELKIHKSKDDYYKINSSSRSFNEEIRTRIYSKILEENFKLDVDRDKDVESYMFSAISLFELSLKDRVEILEFLSSGNITGTQFEFDISLEIESYGFVEKIDSIVAEISLLDKVSGEIDKITDFVLKSPTGGELVILNKIEGKTILSVNTSVPSLLLKNDVLENISKGNKEIIFSINSFRYVINERVFSSLEVENSVLAKNTRFIFFNKTKFQTVYVPFGSRVKDALDKLGQNYDFLSSGEIVGVNGLKSSNISSINPELLKEYEYDRTSWYGIGNKNNVDDLITSDYSFHGVFLVSNIDLMNGHRKKFEYDISDTKEINLSLYRNDFTVLEFTKSNKVFNSKTINYKYSCCEMSGRNDVQKCRNISSSGIKVETSENNSVDPDDLARELSFFYLNKNPIDFKKMSLDKKVYISRDRSKLYMMLDADSTNYLTLKIKDGNDDILNVVTGDTNSHRAPSCELGSGIWRNDRVITKKEQKNFNIKATVFGISTLDRNQEEL